MELVKQNLIVEKLGGGGMGVVSELKIGRRHQ
jgi:hypothetical protein